MNARGGSDPHAKPHAASEKASQREHPSMGQGPHRPSEPHAASEASEKASQAKASQLLAGPVELDRRSARPRGYPRVAAHRGLVIEDRGTGVVGAIVEFVPPRIIIRDRHGRDHMLRYADGAVLVDGQPVSLRRAPAPIEEPGVNASGSIDLGSIPARIARASRIWVEGVHDAELVEKIWGDDLRVEGVVVERLDGVDDLESRVRGFRPGPGRRLGILLDHLVPGSKEHRVALAITHPDVLVRGHPYVDVWQAVRPHVIGIESWPEVPPGQPWKDGILAALGTSAAPGQFWRQLLAAVNTWKDLEPPLLGAVEELIDFVAPPES